MAALVYYGFRMQPDDIVYDCLPLYHSAGSTGPTPSASTPPEPQEPHPSQQARWSQIWVQIWSWQLTGPLDENGHTSLPVCGRVLQGTLAGQPFS